MMRTKSSAGIALALTLLASSLAACGARLGPARPAGSRDNVLGHDQLAATNASNVYEAVQKLRPNWMSGRGPISASNPNESRANVYSGGVRVGDLSYLSSVRVDEVAELHYYDPGQASARFGMGNGGGVIELVRR